MSRQGVYIRIDGHCSRISSYRHWLSPSHTEVHDKVAPEGKIYLVKFPDCGSSDFVDDGRYCNEYSCCACVESYMEVYFYG